MSHLAVNGRKWLAIMCLFLCAGFSSNAGTYGGIAAGAGMTALHSGGESTSYRSGVSLPYGLFLHHRIARHWAFEATVLHVLAGGAQRHSLHPVWYKGQKVYADCLSELNLHYVSADLLLQYRTDLNAHLAVYVDAGIVPAILVAARQTDKGWGNVYPADDRGTWQTTAYFEQENGMYRDYEHLSLGIAAGAGVQWTTGRELVALGLIARRGLTSIRSGTGLFTGHYGVQLSYGHVL